MFKRSFWRNQLFGLSPIPLLRIHRQMLITGYCQHAWNLIQLSSVLYSTSKLVSKNISSLYRQYGLLYPPKLAVRVDLDPTSYYCGQNENYFEVTFNITYIKSDFILSFLPCETPRTKHSGCGDPGSRRTAGAFRKTYLDSLLVCINLWSYKAAIYSGGVERDEFALKHKIA